MTGYPRSAVHAYTRHALENEINSASPHKLILMLFDGALASIAQARKHIEASQISAKGNAISKAIAIVEEGLRLSLDKNVGGELAQNLDALYEYISHRLLLANIQNDVAMLDESTQLLNQLRDAWQGIAPQGGGAPTDPASPPPPDAGDRQTASYGKV